MSYLFISNDSDILSDDDELDLNDSIWIQMMNWRRNV